MRILYSINPKQYEKKRNREKQKTSKIMADLNQTVSVMTFTINELNTPTE